MRLPGGIVRAEGLGDDPTQGKIAIAKLRLTMPPTTLGDFAFALLLSDAGGVGEQVPLTWPSAAAPGP